VIDMPEKGTSGLDPESLAYIDHGLPPPNPAAPADPLSGLPAAHGLSNLRSWSNSHCNDINHELAIPCLFILRCLTLY